MIAIKTAIVVYMIFFIKLLQNCAGRTQTSKSGFDPVSTQDFYYTSKGGKDAWPNTKYLNIWVINILGSKLGGAVFPGAPAAIDGLVITYKAFGRVGEACHR